MMITVVIPTLMKMKMTMEKNDISNSQNDDADGDDGLRR